MELGAPKLLMARFCGIFLSLVLFCLPAFAQVSSSLLLQNESFISPDYQATDQVQYQFLGYRAKSEEDANLLNVDSELVMAVGAPLLNYIKIKDLSAELKSSDKEKFVFGRRQQFWSSLDSRWAFGVIEPTFEWNPLSRERLALTGIFWQRDESDFSLSAFWSPLYIPDQGPSFEIDNQGKFTQKNPWFQTPPKTFRPFSSATSDSTIKYSLKRPPNSEIIGQTSLGGSFEKLMFEKLLTRVTYFYKPMNQLALAYSGAYVVSTDQGQVDLLPEVIYHRVVAADLIFKSGLFEMGASYIQDHPTNESFDTEWTAPVYEDAQIYSAYVQINRRHQKFSFEYLTLENGRVSEVGDLANSTRAPISSRYPLTEAYKIRHQMNLNLKAQQRLSLDTSWTHSDRNQFDLFQIRGTFQYNRKWQIYSDMQLVKAKQLNVKNVNDMTSFADNDRLLVGVAHAL
jgi:hypothetical protein